MVDLGWGPVGIEDCQRAGTMCIWWTSGKYLLSSVMRQSAELCSKTFGLLLKLSTLTQIIIRHPTNWMLKLYPPESQFCLCLHRKVMGCCSLRPVRLPPPHPPHHRLISWECAPSGLKAAWGQGFVLINTVSLSPGTVPGVALRRWLTQKSMKSLHRQLQSILCNLALNYILSCVRSLSNYCRATQGLRYS